MNMSPFSSIHELVQVQRSVDQLENIVVDPVLLVRSYCKLEGLSVVHGALLLINLQTKSVTNSRLPYSDSRTLRAPVTRIITLPSPMPGWASRVAISCLTFWKGRPYTTLEDPFPVTNDTVSTYNKLVNDVVSAEYGC